MTKTLEKVLADLPASRRSRVLARAAEISDEHKALQALRKLRVKTQGDVAKRLGVTQPYVAKLEQRSDLMISVLRKYVESVGGTLELSVKFPDTERVVLHGLGEEEAA